MSIQTKVINFPQSKEILCQYTNTTPTMQVIRLLDSPFNGLEKIISPGMMVQFKALPESYLEVSQFGYITALVDEIISCKKLRQINHKFRNE